MSVYNLKYFGEIQNYRGHCARVEIYVRDESSVSYDVLEIGNICGLLLELQGSRDDIIVPIVKTQLRLSMVETNQATADGVKYGGWQEFYTSDDTLYKVVLKTKAAASDSNWTTRWSGYITPDSWRESLDYGGAITIVARDNIGHLQDFEFDPNGVGTASGLMSIEDIVNGAMSVISFPMTLQWLGDGENTGELQGGSTLLRDAYISEELYKGKSWEDALSGVLDSAGLTLRFTDNNTFTIAPLRYLPNMGHDDPSDQASMPVMEFYSGDAELVPAAKSISETHNYDPNEEVYEPLTQGLGYNSSEIYKFSFESVGGDPTDWVRDRNFHVEAYYTPISNPGSTVWENASDLLVPYNNWLTNWKYKELVDGYALLAANSWLQATTDVHRSQSLSCLCHTSDVTIKLVFAGTPITIMNTNNWPGPWAGWKPLELNGGLTYIKYQLSYTVGNSTMYWNGKEWVSSAQTITQEYDPNNYASELEIRLTKCRSLGDGGRLAITFVDIHYQAISQPTLPSGYWEWRGVYARLNRVAISANTPKLRSSSVTTLNNDSYNVKLQREPDFLPLSKTVDWINPQSYPTAVYSSGPELFPFKVKWSHEDDCVEKPLPVFIHQQILCYYGASLWQLYGDCAPSGKAMFWFNRIARYKDRNFILQSGVWDLMTGVLQGAILREYIAYDDIWDDTSSDVNWTEGYSTDAASGESGSGSSGGGGSSSGGGGGGVSIISVWRSLTNNPNLEEYDENTLIAPEHIPSFFEEDGQGAIKLKDQYTGLWAAGFGSFGGQNSSGGGGGSVDLDRVWESLTNNTDKPNVKINAAHIPIATAGAIGGVKVDGTSIVIDANGVISAVGGGGSGSVTSVGLTVPTGLQVSGSPVTGAGVLALSYATGYSIPLTADTQKGVTAYGWGDHSQAGYLTAVPKATDSVIGGFQTGYTESGKNYAVKMSGNKAYVNVPWTDTVYSLPLAASGTRGGIQVGFSESNSGSSSNRNYAVQLSSEKAYVNVPWTDTVYTHPTGGANTTITAAAGKVLSAITVDSLGHVSSVSSKTLTTSDIPDLSGSYLPLTGGKLTGDLWLKTGDTNYGSKLWFGDKGSGDGYVYLHEDTDDHLKIYARKGIELGTSSGSYGIKFGDGVLKWDSTNQAWHLEGNLYADGFIVAGGLGSSNTQFVTISGAQTISGAKTFTAAATFQQHVTFGEINVGNIGFTGSGTTPSITNSLDRIYFQRTGQTGISMCAAAGMVVIGALSAGAGITTPKLYVAGDALAAGAWNTSSDGRLKDEIEAVYSDRALAVLMQLKPREWVWNENNAALCGKRGAGFIAQEVQPVLPFAVIDDGGYMGLNYQALHAYEVAGLQNHEERIAALEAENKELRRRLGYGS